MRSIKQVRTVLFLLVLSLTAFVAQPAECGHDSRPVRQEVRFSHPRAGEVFLVWGVDGWKILPEEIRPPGTALKDGVMHTHMAREGEWFTARVQAPAGATVDYGFLITKTSQGLEINPVWEGSEQFKFVASEPGVTEVKATVTMGAMPEPGQKVTTSMVTQEFRYRLEDAGEVTLVWGINGWQALPEAQRQGGTVLENNVMHTPMRKEADVFSAVVQVPRGATIQYGFLTSRTSDGEAIRPLWDGNDAYQNTATQNGVLEHQGDQTALEREKRPYVLTLVSILAGVALLSAGVGFLVNLYQRRDNWRGMVLVLCGLLLLGLVLRINGSLVWNSAHPDSAERLLGDEPNYDNIARELLQGHGFTWPGRVPLYPVWLAAVYLFSGGSYQAVPYFQSFLGLSVIVLTYRLGWRVAGPTAGMIAAAWASVSYTLIHQSFHLLSEALYTPVLILVALALFDALHSPSLRRFAWAGALVGISNLIRPTLLAYPLFLVTLLIFLAGRRKLLPFKLLPYGAVYLASSLIVVSPWVIHNYIRYQAIFALQTSNAILWQGSPEYYHLIHDQGYTYERIWMEILYGPGWQARDPNSIAGDRYWTRRALQSITAEPLVYLKFAGEKIFTFWLGDPSADWGGEPVFSYGGLREIGFSPQDAIKVMVLRALPLLAFGSILLLRAKWRRLAPILVLLLYFTLLHALTHAEARLSEPLQPFLFILIAMALSEYTLRAACRWPVWRKVEPAARLFPAAWNVTKE